MKLIYESAKTTKSASEAIFTLVPVGGAIICVDDIQYDETSGFVKIPMKRTEFLEWKKVFFFGKRLVTSEPKIDSILTIRDVVKLDMQVDDILRNECNSCFTVLFGMKIDGNELYLGSVEEARGVTLCHIFIEVKKINIEFVDIESPN